MTKETLSYAVVNSISYSGRLDERIPVSTARKIISTALEQYASQPKWISVEERLPTEEGLYLVFRKHPEKGTFMYEIEQYRMGKDGRFFWYDYLFITHWQPLPTPPTK